MVWVGKFLEIVPVSLVETGEGCEDEDCFEVAFGVGGGGNIVERVVDDWRWLWSATRCYGLLLKRCSRRRERICGWGVVLSFPDRRRVCG